MTKKIQLDRKECDRLTSLDDQKLLSELTERTLDLVGGALTAETMGHLSADQITLIAYYMMRGEVLEGGFIQLIHNGYGPFIFKNPLVKALQQALRCEAPLREDQGRAHGRLLRLRVYGSLREV